MASLRLNVKLWKIGSNYSHITLVLNSFFLMISKSILQSEVIHLAEWSVGLQWLGERHSVEPLHN
jgi:hypothetical protein